MVVGVPKHRFATAADYPAVVLQQVGAKAQVLQEVVQRALRIWMEDDGVECAE